VDIETRLILNNLQIILAFRNLEVGGRVQQYIDSEVLRLCDPYLPFQSASGGLKDAGINGTDIGSGTVKWNGPYARYLYYGKLMVGPNGSSWVKHGEKKHLTNRDLTYNGAPKRGSYWFERMKAAHLKGILQGAARIAGGRV